MKINSYKKVQKGFTLIELLVVIGILGVLAAALIATIDPFEQLKKASDTNVKNTVVEFVNANVRYYSTHNEMPTACTSGALAASNDPCVLQLINDGELKQAFTTATGVFTWINYVADPTGAVTACFKPNSKAQQRDPNTKYEIDGTTCADPASGTCYWCAL